MEQAISWMLRLATYFVLLCAAFIFWDIGTKGGSVIFQSSFPFINTKFLTESPETLNVFELDGKKHTMGDRAFRQFKTENPEKLKGVAVETFVYSAGGIFPNIVGTILLPRAWCAQRHLSERVCDRWTLYPLSPTFHH
jgi:phosphate transport system permease protein